MADIVTDCFPVAQKFQSLSYGPAGALSIAVANHFDQRRSTAPDLENSSSRRAFHPYGGTRLRGLAEAD
jgi:hypothetical protein